MTDIVPRSRPTAADLNHGRKLRLGAITAPIALTAFPIIVFAILTVVLSGAPIFAVSTFLLGVVATILGFLVGVSVSGYLLYQHRAWTVRMREMIASNGISASEVDWFRNELKPSEKRALKELKAKDLLLEDAYRETLASRLTATRIVKLSRKELSTARRREAKIKSLRAKDSDKFLGEIRADRLRIEEINGEAKAMLSEAESRLQMIEAAASRGSGLSGTDVALKKLAARAEQLPLALEAARIKEDTIAEIEAEGVFEDGASERGEERAQ